MLKIRGVTGLLLLTLIVAAMVTACGQEDPTATPVPTATPTSPPQAEEQGPTPTPDAAAAFAAEWEALIAAAQAESGLVLVLGGGAGRNFRPVVEFFGEKFGIDTVVSTGSGTAQANRVLAEREVGSYLVDIMYVGPTSANTRLIPAQILDPLEEQFIHPEVLDKSLWFKNQYWWADVDQRYVFTFAAAAGPIQTMRYNTDLMTQADLDGINSVWDYVDPARFAGKIVAISPLIGGAGGTFYEAYVHPDIGREWVDAFVDPALDVTFLEDSRQIVDGVTNGVWAFATLIGSTGNDLDALAGLGAPVEKFPCSVKNVCVKEFIEGGVIQASGSSSNMMIPTNRPNPNATKLWVNWFLSKEGQTIMHTMAQDDPNPTLRTDVTDFGNTLPYERRVEGADYFFFSSDPTYTVLRDEALQYAKDAFRAVR